jgi:hypothetical protein
MQMQKVISKDGASISFVAFADSSDAFLRVVEPEGGRTSSFPAFGGFYAVAIRSIESKAAKTSADAARLFNVHPATISRLLASARIGTVRVEV